MPDTAVRQWVSSGYVPGHFGSWGVTGPLVVVKVADSRVTVRLRPKFLARLMGVAPLIADSGSGLMVTTSRAMKPWGWLIEFRLPGERPYSFQTTRLDEVLSSLEEAGFEVPARESR